MIRPAVATDINRLVEMGKAFHADAGWAKYADFDIESFAFTCERLSKAGVLLVAEEKPGVVGMIGTAIGPGAWWNRTMRTGHELFWFCEPEHRKTAGRALIKGCDEILAAHGVRVTTLTSEEGRHDHNLVQFYKVQGYAPAERTYWKVLA